MLATGRHADIVHLLALAIAATWPAFANFHDRGEVVSVDRDELRWIPPGNAVPLSPSALEARLARQFPGRVDRYADGQGVWIVRGVDRPTRMLHPASDCFRGLGYAITLPQVRADTSGEAWSCFSASRDGSRLQVCERIFDQGAGRWSDVSAWYWSALVGSGPWWAVTRVSAE